MEERGVPMDTMVVGMMGEVTRGELMRKKATDTKKKTSGIDCYVVRIIEVETESGEDQIQRRSASDAEI